MTDQELLELAAKAAGYEIDFDSPVNGWYSKGYDENGDPAEWWNPLTDDGDALRLAVNLEMSLDLTIATQPHADVQANEINIHCKNDPYAATRRAIVRAAAEIAKKLPGAA
jgi:hypothetical protein